MNSSVSACTCSSWEPLVSPTWHFLFSAEQTLSQTDDVFLMCVWSQLLFFFHIEHNILINWYLLTEVKYLVTFSQAAEIIPAKVKLYMYVSTRLLLNLCIFAFFSLLKFSRNKQRSMWCFVSLISCIFVRKNQWIYCFYSVVIVFMCVLCLFQSRRPSFCPINEKQDKETEPDAGRTAVVFSLKNEVGGLVRALRIFQVLRTIINNNIMLYHGKTLYLQYIEYIHKTN